MSLSSSNLCRVAVLAFSLAAAGQLGSQGGVPFLLNHQGRITTGPGTNFDGTGFFKFALVDGGTNKNTPAFAEVTAVSGGGISAVEIKTGGEGYTSPPAVQVSGTGSGAVLTAEIRGGSVSEILIEKKGEGYAALPAPQVVIDPPPPSIVNNRFWQNDGSQLTEPAIAVSLPVTNGHYSVLLGDTSVPNMAPIPRGVFANSEVYLRLWFSSSEGDPFEQLQPDHRVAAVGYALMASEVPDASITSSKLAPGAVDLSQLSPELQATINNLVAWQQTQLPIITSPTAIEVGVDTFLNYQVTATGSPSSFAASGLPAGLDIDPATGLVTGTSTSPSDFSFDVTATNGAGTGAPTTVNVTVFAPIYVDAANGNDVNNGSMGTPVQTLQQGIDLANVLAPKRSVRVSTAPQITNGPVVLADGVSVYGGFNANGGWSGGGSTPLARTAAGVSDLTPAAVHAHNLTTSTTLDRFTIFAPDALAPGGSSVGVWCVDAVDLVFSNNSIRAGAGAPGEGGQGYLPPGGAPPGEDGGEFGEFYRGGGCSKVGPASFVCNDTGDGGMGGFAYQGTLFAPSAGFGATGGAAGTTGNPPTPGGNGLPGAVGRDGAMGTASESLGTIGPDYHPPGAGAGAPGASGGRGGGGGGGGALLIGNTVQSSGGGGGQGGDGGTGGHAGTGGEGGGGSFAILAANSTLFVSSCTLIAGEGGDGGRGGNGSLGGSTGAGGNGRPRGNGGDGGDGGRGGKGGKGGAGAGGSGGPSIGILLRNDASLLENVDNTFAPGTPGTGGAGGQRGTVPNVENAPAGPDGIGQDVLDNIGS